MEYLILDEDHSSLTRGVLRNQPSSPVLEFEIPEADIPRLEGHVDLQFVGFDEHSPSFDGKVTRRRGNRIAVQKGALLEDDSMERLRVPFQHDSFAYPVSGNWTGRTSIKTRELSCGAVTFLCTRLLAMQEVVELAVYLREGALLIPAKIIAQSTTELGSNLYAAKFISGVEDIEQFVRKEVLYLQLKERDDTREGKVRRELFRIV